MKHILLLLLLLSFTAMALKAQDRRPSDDAFLSRGAKLMQSHLFEEAASQFKQALAADPADPRVRFEYGVCLFSLGRDDAARHQFEEARQIGGKSPYVTYYLGRLDLLSNRYQSAVMQLLSISKDPPFPDTAFYLGVAYVSSGQEKKGIDWLERAAKLMPHDYRVHYRLARAYSTAGRRQEAAREYKLYSQDLSEHKNTETEVRACSEALRTEPPTTAHTICQRIYDPNDPDKLTLLGQLYGEAGAFKYALGPLTRAVQLDPNSFEAWHNLGLTYFRLKQYQNARVPLEKAAQLRPESYDAVVLLGATLYMLGDDNAALPVLEHAHRLNPGDTQTAAVLDKLRVELKKK